MLCRPFSKQVFPEVNPVAHLPGQLPYYGAQPWPYRCPSIPIKMGIPPDPYPPICAASHPMQGKGTPWSVHNGGVGGSKFRRHHLSFLG